MEKFKDAAAHVTEWFVSLLFIFGAVSLVGEPPLEATGILVVILGGQIALYAYMAWFAFLGLALIFSKVRYRKKLHKNILMCMYLTCIYTAVLATAFFGFDFLSIIDDIVIGVLTAGLWLRWKLKTEYIDHESFHSEVMALRDDLPPS